MMTLQHAVATITAEMRSTTNRGRVADYIAPLALISPARFGIAVVGADGSYHSGGDAEESFSIQSISKVFALTLALGRVGDQLWTRIGREPSGNAFNSIVQLESEHGRPRNPFINAGAIAVSDVILGGHQPREAIGEIVQFVRSLADDDTIFIDENVAAAERATDHRNKALAHFLAAHGNLENDVDFVLGVYAHHCALALNCRQLAMAGRYLMARGINPSSGHRIISAERARRINAMMLTCGHYDGSGDFAFRVGLPGKSGVGGGILAIVPGRASIAVWSPGLNDHGNSKLGTEALARLADLMKWSIFDRLPDALETCRLNN